MDRLSQPTHSSDWAVDLPPDVENDLFLLNRFKPKSLPFLKRDTSGKIIFGIPRIRTLFVLDEHHLDLRSFLAMHTAAKNPGLIGNIINSLIRTSILLLPYIPLFFLRRINSEIKHQIISWRKGMRYRFISFKNNTMFDLAMPGGQKYIKREIDIRIHFSHILPVPPVLQYDTEGKYFIQPLFNFSSLTNKRLPLSDMNFLLDLVFTKLEKLYSLNRKDVDAKKYWSHLYNLLIKDKNVPSFDKNRIERLLDRVTFPKDAIVISKVHGDLNLGNLLYDRQKARLYIIDWENTDRMSIFHDLFTLKLFIKHIHHYPGINLDKYLEYKCFKDALKNNREENLLFYKQLFFLEKIAMWIEYPFRNMKWLKKIIQIMQKELVKN